jgi:hypothetical protein
LSPRQVKDDLCDFLGATRNDKFLDSLWLGPQVRSTGVPYSNGVQCGHVGSVPRGGSIPRPDFIIKKTEPTKSGYPKAWLIGDVKYSLQELSKKVNPNQSQWKALYNHAKFSNGHQYAPLVFALVFRGGTEAQIKSIEAEAISKGVYMQIITLFD